MRKFLVLLLVLAASISFAQCTKPTITSGPTVSWPTPSSVTFTWTTDVASDSMAFVAFSTGTPDQYDWPLGVGQWWNTSGATDLTGVTNHSYTISGLRPGQSYAYNVRSRCVAAGAPVLDQNHLIFAYEVDNGQTASWSPTITAPALVTTDPASFNLRMSGGHTLYNGYSLIIGFQEVQLAGSDTSISATLSGVPACMSKEFVGWTSQFASGNVISTTVDNGRSHGINVRLTANACTPGAYTITESYVMSPSGWTGSSNYVVNVANLPSFPSGSPSSYPTIPCWQHGSKMTDGTTTCALNFDDQMVTTMAAQWAGTYDVGSHASGGCANTNFPGIGSAGDQWTEYYDGPRVFNQLYDYVLAHPGSTTNPLSMYSQAAQDCGAEYYASAATIGYNQVPGRWTFAQGAVENSQRYGMTAADTFLTSSNSVNSILPNFAQWKTSYTWENLDNAGLRERTYSCDWLLWYMKYNGTDTSQQQQWCVDELLGMADQNINNTGSLEQGFFDGLMSDTLIQSYTDPLGTHDPRIPVVVKALLDHLMDANQHRWAATSPNPNGFCLNCRKSDIGLYQGGESPLNLMTVEPFAWIFSITDPTTGATYRTFGDNAFQYGVLGNTSGYVFHGKPFSEGMRMTPSFIAFRNAPAGTSPSVDTVMTGGIKVSGGVVIK